MYIKTIHIDVFGAMSDRTIDLSRGLNIIEGQNESGKSTVAMFIKFMLYGLSGRGADGALPERRRYVNWETGRAAGYMIICQKDKEYRIERELYVPGADDGQAAEAVRERCVMTDTATGEKVFRGEVPGTALFGITEQMFCNTVFVRQLGDTSVDGTGMTEAIENILFSGDEGLSTRRAADRLDKSRKALLHKNGNGGRIYELKKEKFRLESEMHAASEKNAEIISIETAIAESEAMIGERDAKSAEMSAVLDAYDKLTAARRVDEAVACREQMDELQAELSEFDCYGDIDAGCADIRRMSGEVSAAETQLKTLRRSAAAMEETLPPVMTEIEMAEARSFVGEARTAAKSRKSLFTVSLIFFILAAVLGCAAFFLKSTDMLLCYAAGGCGAAMLTAAVVLLISSFAKLHKFNDILDEWDAEDVDDLSAVINERIKGASLRSDPNSEYGRLIAEIQYNEANRLSAVTDLRAACAVFCADVPDTDIFVENALESASALSARKAELTRKYDTAAGRLSAYHGAENDSATKEIADEIRDTPAGRSAAEMSQDEADKLRRDRGFYATTADAGRARHAELEKKLSVLRATSASPAVLAGKIGALDREIGEQTARYNGLVTAMDALERAGNNLRANLMPRIVSEAGGLMDGFSDGRYTALGVSRGFDITFMKDGRTRDCDFMSAGTRDMAYICLRGALLRVLFPEDTPPSVYDESFARIDEERLARILDLLAEDSGQSVVFTCRTLEGAASAALNGVSLIKLD